MGGDASCAARDGRVEGPGSNRPWGLLIGSGADDDQEVTAADLARTSGLARAAASGGLSSEEARHRLEQVGANELPPPKRPGLLHRLGSQLAEPMVGLLLAAAAVSGLALGETADSIAILGIVVLNALIGLVEEGRATAALDALRRFETPRARARRDGRIVTVPTAEIVPGDVVLLAAGDRVPADARLLHADLLEVDESVLTGESLPVPKLAGPDQEPLLAGTLVTTGSAEASVVATGPATALGRIAAQLQSGPPETPLQRELGGVTLWLGGGAVAVAVFVFGLVAVTTSGPQRWEDAFLSAVALAVAAVPEGLATVTAVALALGVRRMARRGAIVRRLTAVETLGSTTVLVMDKTGTLTENQLRLDAVVQPGRPASAVEQLPPIGREAFEEIAALCNDAATDPRSGDPVDLALLDGIGEARAATLRDSWARIGTIPFDATRARMRTVHQRDDGVLLVAVKGAPEAVLPRCGRALDPVTGLEHPLSVGDRGAVGASADELADGGAKVLALARWLPAIPDAAAGDDGDDERLVLVGLAVLRDPVRPAAATSVATARGAGIRLIMATGDHPGTARAVASAVGLAGSGTEPILVERGHAADDIAADVYARVDPEEKLELVRALRERGEVVAMTGDGVNDAPALRQADIGVALGASGTEVAREAADLVVTDDDLATIVEAVQEGRGIYDNLRKVVEYLVAGNLSEIVLVVGGLLAFAGEGVPLLPLQLLWVNLLTDGAPAIALGLDPVDAGLLTRAPRAAGDRLLTSSRLVRLAVRGLLLAAPALAGLALAHASWDEPWAEARTLAFTLLVTTHLLYSFALGQPTRNRWLVGAVAGGLALQAVILGWSPARDVFHTTSLDGRAWVLVAALPVLAVLAVHWLVRHEGQAPQPVTPAR